MSYQCGRGRPKSKATPDPAAYLAKRDVEKRARQWRNSGKNVRGSEEAQEDARNRWHKVADVVRSRSVKGRTKDWPRNFAKLKKLLGRDDIQFQGN